MVSWRSILIALLTIGGTAGCGIGVIAMIAGSATSDSALAERHQREGFTFGLCGLLIFAALLVVKSS